MRVSIVGFNLPGREFCRPDGSPMSNVHVGVQLRREPVELAGADAAEVRWDIDVDVVDNDGDLDFRGPVVQGRRGDRFVYLTWGEVHPGGGFEMFRRAKLMLNRIDPGLVRAALGADGLDARLDLTGAMTVVHAALGSTLLRSSGLHPAADPGEGSRAAALVVRLAC